MTEVRDKMKIKRLYQGTILLVSVIFLERSLCANENTASMIKNQKQHIAVTVGDLSKKVKVSRKKLTVKSTPDTAKQKGVIDEGDDASLVELQRPLDLSIPYSDVDKSDRLNELDTDMSIQNANIFADDNNKKTRPVQINGKLLMSPEPEVEKQKSADGAGIVINLKP
jgi:hypothetical protein